MNTVSPDSNHVEILCGGSDAWNAWREKNPSTIPDLTGIGLPLRESQMGSLVDLQSALLQEAILRFANLSTVNLEAVDMSGADLTHARLLQANLNAAKLTDARSDYVDFSGASLTKANLCGASLRFATLSKADLEAADLSGADLRHARLDQANLSAANLTNACLDYADFTGVNLTKANLCGATLHHVKNLSARQIEDSMHSASTILPPHLQGSVSWSAAKSQTENEGRDLRPGARNTDDIHIPRISPAKLKAWRVGVLISFALASAAFMWRHIGQAVPLNLSGAQRGSQPIVIEPSLGTNTGAQVSQPAAIGTLMEERATAERRPNGASTIKQTEIAEEPLTSGAVSIPAKGAKPGDQASNTPAGHWSKVGEASKVFFSAQSRHAVPDVMPTESRTGTSPHAIVMQTPSGTTIPDVQTLSPETEIRSPARAGRAKGRNFEEAEAPVLMQENVPVLLSGTGETPPKPIRNPARQGVAGKR